jgi:NAD-dependent DNA ligase
MKQYTLNVKAVLPAWHFDPATSRQLKLLRFFGVDADRTMTKGVCSGIIGRIFSDPANKHLWAAYVFITGDDGDASEELLPHDKSALAQVSIPEDWRPRSSSTTSSAHKALEGMVTDILKDGSPFDDPLPEIVIAETSFCFTGEFDYGTRKECQAAVIARGGAITDGITRKTQVLVIGNDPNPNWSHGSYGNKIADAMILRLQHAKPCIIPELLWQKLLSE